MKGESRAEREHGRVDSEPTRRGEASARLRVEERAREWQAEPTRLCDYYYTTILFILLDYYVTTT